MCLSVSGSKHAILPEVSTQCTEATMHIVPNTEHETFLFESNLVMRKPQAAIGNPALRNLPICAASRVHFCKRTAFLKLCFHPFPCRRK